MKHSIISLIFITTISTCMSEPPPVSEKIGELESLITRLEKKIEYSILPEERKNVISQKLLSQKETVVQTTRSCLQAYRLYECNAISNTELLEQIDEAHKNIAISFLEIDAINLELQNRVEKQPLLSE